MARWWSFPAAGVSPWLFILLFFPLVSFLVPELKLFQPNPGCQRVLTFHLVPYQIQIKCGLIHHFAEDHSAFCVCWVGPIKEVLSWDGIEKALKMQPRRSWRGQAIKCMLKYNGRVVVGEWRSGLYFCANFDRHVPCTSNTTITEYRTTKEPIVSLFLWFFNHLSVVRMHSLFVQITVRISNHYLFHHILDQVKLCSN